MKTQPVSLLRRVLLALLLTAGPLSFQLPVQAQGKNSKETVNDVKDMTAARASRNGRYTDLLAKINCAPDRLDVGRYHVVGFETSDEAEYCGEKAPKQGYWVYVYPDWYVWGKEDLAAVGMELTRQKIKLSRTTLDLEMAYLKKDKAWGESSLSMAAQAIQDLEQYSGKPYPGANPYRIEEDPRLHLSERIGLASAQAMSLADPEYSSPWTILHEAVHIWNAPVRADWVCEGMADTISWLMMWQHKIPFDPDETMEDYMQEWKQVMGTRKDGPLPTDYDRLPQGKAMYFWLMLYQLYGPEFLRQVFVASLHKLTFGPPDLARMLTKVHAKNPNLLFSGWLQPGPYLVRQPSDFGPVKFKLPAEL